MWFQESIDSEEVAFESEVFLLRKTTAEALKAGAPVVPTPGPESPPGPIPTPEPGPAPGPGLASSPSTRTLRVTGNVPPEVWNRLGTTILPKLRAGADLRIGVDFSVTISADEAGALAGELRQILAELGLGDAVRVE